MSSRGLSVSSATNRYVWVCIHESINRKSQNVCVSCASRIYSFYLDLNLIFAHLVASTMSACMYVCTSSQFSALPFIPLTHLYLEAISNLEWPLDYYLFHLVNPYICRNMRIFYCSSGCLYVFSIADLDLIYLSYICICMYVWIKINFYNRFTHKYFICLFSGIWICLYWIG